MSDMLISIIVPIYNVQDYITECLESIAAQTCTDSVECILIDDCGDDGSMKLAREFVDHYKGDIHFRILSHEHNRGLSAARNTGIIEAVGKYVYFIDGDDYIFPDCLKHLVEVALKYPDVEMIAAGAKITNKKKAKYFTMEKPFPDYANNPQWIARTLLIRGGWKGIPVTAWNRLVRKDFLLQHHLFFLEGLIHEDELWNFMLAQKLGSIAFCKHDTYNYRLRMQSITTSYKSKDERALVSIPLWHEILNRFSPDMQKEETHALWQIINDSSPSCYDQKVRKETRGILWQLVRKKIWPTSFLIILYLMPFIFYIKFIRKQVAHLSRIDADSYSCCIS
jgi:glycosyltransferase involved in cell wall biosynthesis